MLLDQIGTGPAASGQVQALATGAYVAARVSAGNADMSVDVFLREGSQTASRSSGSNGPGLAKWSRSRHRRRAPIVACSPIWPRRSARSSTPTRSYNGSRGTQYSSEEGVRPAHDLRANHFLRHHACVDEYAADRCQRASLGTGARSGRVASNGLRGSTPDAAATNSSGCMCILKPDTREVLEKSQEFFRDHENTVYHAGYPHSYRQAGKEPNIQFSMAEDGLQRRHRRRLPLQQDPAKHVQRSPDGVQLRHPRRRQLDKHGAGGPGTYYVVAVLGTPGGVRCPSSRDLAQSRSARCADTAASGQAPGASPERIEDAVQEFLTDWLVRHQYDQALEFLSPRAYACLNLNEDARGQALDAAGARRELQRIMDVRQRANSARTATSRASLLAFTPRDPTRVVSTMRSSGNSC